MPPIEASRPERRISHARRVRPIPLFNRLFRHPHHLPTMMKPTSFQTDIRPLFTEPDIQGMRKGFNLESYDDVKKHAAAIYDRIRGIGGPMMPPPPPRGEGPWSQSRIELFAKWMSDGFLP